MKNQKKKSRTKYDIAYTCMLVIAILIILGTGTYAYYRSTMTGTTSGTIAKWSFTANDQASTINLDFDGLYPGKSDVKYLELSAENSDVPVGFELLLHLPSEYETLYASLVRYYFNSDYSIGPNVSGTVGIKGWILEGEKITIPIYYNWPYDETNDSSELGTTVAASDASIPITIIGRQLDKTSQTAFENSILVDMLGITAETTCTSSRYGYPCDYVMSYGDAFLAGSPINYTLNDGSVIEFFDTAAISINLGVAE